jgi:SAM-dependent methyltransferase
VEPPVSFDRIAGQYDATRGLPPELQAFVLQHLLRMMRGARLLDAGVGTARFALPLQVGGVDVVGIDVSRAMMQTARSKGFARLVRADVRAMPFRDRAFDWAMSNHLLHLVKDWPSALSEIARVTRGQYASVFHHEKESPDIPHEYYRILEREGVRSHHPGLHERKLPRSLPPDGTVTSDTSHRSVPAEVVLDLLDRQVYSSSWLIDPESHSRAIDELRPRFAGAVVDQQVSVEVATWRIDRLRSFADEARRTGAPASPPVGG